MTTINDIEQLFRRNYTAMFILANRLLHDEELAKDIVHDIFASLLSANMEYITPAWLLRGVRLACLNHIRNMSTRDRLTKLYALDCHEIEDDTWPDEEMIARIDTAVDRHLTEQTRKVVMMRFRSRLTYKEIAREMEISEVAVYKHLRHAMDVLRKIFNEYER